MAWSEDGRMLAILTSHVAAVTLIDVEWALAHPEIQNPHWVVRGFSHSGEGGKLQYGKQRTFVSAQELQLQICAYSLEESRRRSGDISWAETPHAQTLRIPDPLVADARP